MIYLDTHVVVWLYAGLSEKFSRTARELINEYDARISPIVRLELGYLNEINRVTERPDTIVADLSNRIGLKICDKDFNAIVSEALGVTWTRDPFDRVIVANASLNDDILVTKDPAILERYPNARW